MVKMPTAAPISETHLNYHEVVINHGMHNLLTLTSDLFNFQG